MKKLTLIIPFLNEGDEVRKTVGSMLPTAGTEIDLILVNDASTDGYDYRSIAKNYNAFYIEHTQRKGVATSRDEAIGLCRTPYFLLLDAHMRSYTTGWACLLLEILEHYKQTIFCCQTLPLDTDGKLTTGKPSGYGAYIDFADLSVKWNAVDTNPGNALLPIGCLLGASYATSTHYWKYLKGLTGLRSYGYDEQLISLKCWLAGGSCYLIKEIVFGHIFRTLDQVAYPMPKMDFLFNRFYVATLFFDETYKQTLFSKLRHPNPAVIQLINRNIQAEKKQIDLQKRYYARIFKQPISLVKEMNDRLKSLQPVARKDDEDKERGRKPF